MVIEDEEILLHAITSKLKKVGMETVSCTKVEQALDYLEELETLPSAIWLDYYLKGDMNGLDFLIHIKKNEKWKKIPVIIVSNTASEQKVKKMLALGADKYLLKAENRLEEIINVMKGFVESNH